MRFINFCVIKSLAFLVLCFSYMVPVCAQPENEVLEIRHPETKNPVFADRNSYSLKLLELALNKKNIKHKLAAVRVEIGTSQRNIRFISEKQYDISWLHTSREREKQLLPIRIPLFKGLIGWRIGFIRQQDLERFNAIKTLKQLQNVRFIQGYGWPDNVILNANNFTVRTTLLGTDTANIINLMHNSRADYFPRSVLEIWPEQENYGGGQLMIEPNLALYYPSATYFFVAKTNIELAKNIEEGLQLAIQDGSFDKLFNHYFAEIIKRSDLRNRHIFYLTNPNLPKNTPLDRPELWLALPHAESADEETSNQIKHAKAKPSF